MLSHESHKQITMVFRTKVVLTYVLYPD